MDSIILLLYMSSSFIDNKMEKFLCILSFCSFLRSLFRNFFAFAKEPLDGGGKIETTFTLRNMMSSIFLSSASLMLRNLLHCLIVGKSSRVCFLFNFLCFLCVFIRSALNPSHYFMPKAEANYTRRDYHYFHFSHPFVRPCSRRLLLFLKQVLREAWDFNDFEFNPTLYQCSRWLSFLRDCR